ncbi:MAG: hypothetical protein AAB855_01620 [Patescibacteria group bacterium]
MPRLQSLPVKLFDATVPFLIVLIFAGIFGSFFYYIVQPELLKYLPGGTVNENEVKLLLDARTIYRDDLANLADFVKTAEENKQDPISLILPSNVDVPTLYALFEKLSADVGVGLQVIDIGSTSEDGEDVRGQIAKVPIALRFVNVDYPTLKRLLAALEQNIRLTSIESLAYDPLGRSVSLEIFTYYFNQ